MEVQITNPFYLRHLEKLRSDFFDTEGYHDEEFYTIHQDYNNGEYYCSPEYLNVMRLKNHDGYPDAGFCQPLSKMATVDHRNWKPFWEYWKYEFPPLLGATHNALLNYYPVGGFIGWHTNQNASAYQMMFTYSEKGKGYFNYYDMEEDLIVSLEDKKGWQCRWYYFGSDNEPEKHFWHSAYSGCDRFTMTVKFSDKNMLDMAVNDLTSSEQ